MSTINVSMPESLRAYVEAQAQSGGYTVSEYIRHLVRQDRESYVQEEKTVLNEYIGLCAQQLRQGDISTRSIEDIIAQGEQRYHARRQPAS